MFFIFAIFAIFTLFKVILTFFFSQTRERQRDFFKPYLSIASFKSDFGRGKESALLLTHLFSHSFLRSSKMENPHESIIECLVFVYTDAMVESSGGEVLLLFPPSSVSSSFEKTDECWCHACPIYCVVLSSSSIPLSLSLPAFNNRKSERLYTFPCAHWSAGINIRRVHVVH